ncbi:MAG: DEAD/DEAH box helicase [Candidatus Micrarchaeia archaeon]
MEYKNVFDIFLKKYKNYTQIQELTLKLEPNVNRIIIAPTGSGKTEAALLPVLNKLQAEAQKDRGGIKLIYITPLRALNRDMIKRISWLCNELGLSVSVRHGDTSQSERNKQVRNAPDVLITTPETMQSILPTKSFHNALKNVKAIIIDEIHELYSSKRGAQLTIALERLEELAPSFQRIGISATVASPNLIKNFLCSSRQCEIVQVNESKAMHLAVESPIHVHSKHAKELKEKFGLDDFAIARLSSIANHIASSSSTLIFANTRQIVEALGSRLLYLNSIEDFGGIGVHHSSLDREDRIKLEDMFKEGKIKSIIATSSLELGIDIGSIDLVVQYGSPRQAIRLIQRVGRSGHSTFKTPKGVVIAPTIIDTLETIAIFENSKNKIIEKQPMHENALDVLANQIAGIALDKFSCTLEVLESIIKKSYLYKNIESNKIISLLNFMNSQRIVYFDGKNISIAPRTRMYYYEHLSVIPDSKHYSVINIIDNKRISSLDERFVMSELDEGSMFITKGLPWKVISIENDSVLVEPSSDLEAAVPDWIGEDIPVANEVASKVFEIFSKGFDNTFVNVELNKRIREFIVAQNKNFSLKKPIIESIQDATMLHTGLGTLANEALARAISYLITKRFGKSVNIKVSPYSILFEAEPELVRNNLINLNTTNIENIVKDALVDSELFRYKFIVIAKLFGLIDKDATISKNIAKKLVQMFRESPVYDEALRELMYNYFDLSSLKFFLEKFDIKGIQIVYSNSLSPISKAILESSYYTSELIMPVLPSSAVIESFANSILSKNIKMICTYCGFEFTRNLKDLEGTKEIKCANCGSTMIAEYNDNFKKIIEKRKKNALSKKEKDIEKEMMKIASLFQSYGGRAAIALSTYGIGSTTASRVLMMLRRDEKLFFLDLLDAQRQFIKNKKYWSLQYK